MIPNHVDAITRDGRTTKFIGIVTALCLVFCANNPASAREKRLDFVNTKLWDTVEHPNRFPETDDREVAVPWLGKRASFGIVFSGGGTRSASATLGQLRALHKLGWLNKAKYIAANSGGSWASVPYTFLPESISDDTFLGKYLPPENITDHELSREYSDTEKESLSFAISNTEVSKKGILEALVKGDEAYARLVGSWFLEPFGLHDSAKFFTFHEASRDAAIRRNNENGASGHFLKPADFYLARSSRPYLIINATLIASDKKKAVKERALYPVEITPIYTGIRGRFTTKTSADPDAPRMIGGGYVESFGYDTNPPATPGSGDGVVKAKFVCKSKLKVGLKSNKRYRFTLSNVIASSGAAPTEKLIEKGTSNLVFPEFRHWAVHDRPAYAEKDCSDDLEFPHGDGGHTDNIALISLLVRQVKNILVFVNTRHELCGAGEIGMPSCKEETTTINCTDQPELENGCVPNGVINEALVSYFRQTEKKPYNVVFENGDSRLHTLYSALKKKKKVGEPLVHCEEYSVIENQRYKVSEYKPHICWVYLDAPQAWLDSIPDSGVNNKVVQELKEGKRPLFKITEQSLNNLQGDGVPPQILEKLKALKDQELNTEKEFLEAMEKEIGIDQTVNYNKPILKHAGKREKGKHFSRFPHYRTFEENPPHLVDLSPEQVRALSNLTAWTVMQSTAIITQGLNTARLTD